MVIAALAVGAAVVGFVSSRSGPFQSGSPSGPIAVLAPGVSSSPEASASLVPSVAPVSSSPDSVDWVDRLVLLDAARSAAFAQPTETSALAAVDLVGSPVMRRDEQLRQMLVRRGLHAEGFALRIVSAKVIDASARSVRLLVVDTMDHYVLKDARGGLVERNPGRGERQWVMTLRLGGDGWRYSDIAVAESAKNRA